MTDRHRTDHDEQLETAAAWVLGALPEGEATAFAAHLEGCPDCRDEVARLQPVADALPLAAPSAAPSPGLKARIMAEVEREAELLAAAGPEADKPPVRKPERRSWWSRLPARPSLVAAGAAVVLGIGVTAGLLAASDDGGGTRTLSASVTALGPGGATHGELVQSGSRAELRVDGVPSPPPGRVYQVWIVRGGQAAPDAVFTVDRDGDGSVVLEGDLAGAEKVLITSEPEGGSRRPTSQPTLGATPA